MLRLFAAALMGLAPGAAGASELLAEQPWDLTDQAVGNSVGSQRLWERFEIPNTPGDAVLETISTVGFWEAPLGLDNLEDLTLDIRRDDGGLPDLTPQGLLESQVLFPAGSLVFPGAITTGGTARVGLNPVGEIIQIDVDLTAPSLWPVRVPTGEPLWLTLRTPQLPGGAFFGFMGATGGDGLHITETVQGVFGTDPDLPYALSGTSENLLVNGSFHQNVAGWGPGYTWSSPDADGSPESGSGRIERTSCPSDESCTGFGGFQCVSTREDQSYGVGARILLPAATGSGSSWGGRARVFFYASEDCSGDFLSVELTGLAREVGSWQSVGTQVLSPPGTRSARVDTLLTFDDTGLPAVAHFDDVRLPEPGSAAGAAAALATLALLAGRRTARGLPRQRPTCPGSISWSSCRVGSARVPLQR